MPQSELRRIVDDGLKELSLSFGSRLKDIVVWMSCGLPYFTHLLCEELATFAISNARSTVELGDIHGSIVSATQNVDEKIRSEYDHALLGTQWDLETFKLSMVETSTDLKRCVVHAAALAAAPSADCDTVAEVFHRLARLIGLRIPSEYKIFAGAEIEAIVEGIAFEPDAYVKVVDSRVQFRSPFHHAYALLRALGDHQGAASASDIIKLCAP